VEEQKVVKNYLENKKLEIKTERDLVSLTPHKKNYKNHEGINFFKLFLIIHGNE
jgi:hypothetical protein